MSATSVQALERLRDQLIARAAKITADIAEAQLRGTREQAAILDALPKKLGVANMEAVASMLRARIRGEFGPLATGGVGAGTAPKPSRGAPVRLTDLQHTMMDQLLTQVLAPGYVGDLTSKSIAESVGCSQATVDGRRAELKKALAAPTPETPPAAAAVA